MEKTPPGNSEIYDIKTLSPQTKMRMVLEIFDLSRDKESNEKRRSEFIKLLGKYHEAMIKSVTTRSKLGSNITYIESSDVNKKKIHNEIMDVLTKMSLSLGLNKDQRELIDYLARNRDEVERIIGAYFLGGCRQTPFQTNFNNFGYGFTKKIHQNTVYMAHFFCFASLKIIKIIQESEFGDSPFRV